MTNEQILKKAIDKVMNNGWSGQELMNYTCGNVEITTWAMNDIMMNVIKRGYWHQLIFSHSFAKAFWGEEEKFKDPEVFVSNGDGTAERPISGFGWEYHLKQMVLYEKPLKYIEKYL